MTSEETVAINWNGISYVAMIIVSILFIIIGIVFEDSNDILFSVPVLAISILYLRDRNRHTTLTPKLCYLLIILMALSHLTDNLFHDNPLLGNIADFIFGMFLAVTGIVAIRIMLRNAPELDRGRPLFISFCAFCISVTLSEILNFGSIVLNSAVFNVESSYDAVVYSLFWAIFGAFVAVVVYYIDTKTTFFGLNLGKRLSFGTTEADLEIRKNGIRELISQGESSTLEFKATLRTNLATEQKDPRMEKAVLKTIVAFLNTRGGTLLIGVTDSGEIAGADEYSFDNRDKMLLHLNHLIEDRIGKEFIPLIDYYIVDFDGKAVIRVDCNMSDAPVFLLDGKEQVFYIRSGPSSIDLHGLSLLKYANRNFGRVIKRTPVVISDGRDDS